MSCIKVILYRCLECMANVLLYLFQSYDECVKRRLPECMSAEDNFAIIPYFCGQAEFCRYGIQEMLHCNDNSMCINGTHKQYRNRALKRSV